MILLDRIHRNHNYVVHSFLHLHNTTEFRCIMFLSTQILQQNHDSVVVFFASPLKQQNNDSDVLFFFLKITKKIYLVFFID